MNSSGIKRGLATSAIAALAITGIPAIANADTLAADTTGVDLHAPQSTTASIRNDGTNSTVSLVATAETEIDYVQFQYDNGTSWVNIGTPVARSASGEFQREWTPGIALVNTDVNLRAVEATVVGPITESPDVSATETVRVSGTASAIEINGSDQDKGYFVQPYVDADADGGTEGGIGEADPRVESLIGVTGTVSSDATTVTVASGVDSGPSAAQAPTVNPAPTATPNAPVGFEAVATVGDLDTTQGAVNQSLVRLTTDANTDDAEGFNLYRQQITNVTAEAVNSNVPSGGATEVVVTVLDQFGDPVAGAHVGAIPTAGDADEGDPSVYGAFTNGRGQVVFEDVSAGTHRYYVDTTNDEGFTNGQDRSATVTVGSFDPRPTTIEFTSEDGAAFDYDEFAAGDMYVTVEDQNGNPVANEFVFYTIRYTPFEASSTDQPATYQGEARTDADGRVNIIPGGDLAPENLAEGALEGGTFTIDAYVNRDGTPPGQDAADLALETATVKAGEATPMWSAPESTDRQAGTDQTFTGTLELADGTTLAGRLLEVTYTPGDEGEAAGNSGIATQTLQPAGTTRVSNTRASVVTREDGSFAVVVRDPAAVPASAQQDELGANLFVTGTDVVPPATATDDPTDGIDDDQSDDVDIDWLVSATPQSISITGDLDDQGTEATADDDAFLELIDNAATPGRPVTFEVVLQNADQEPLAGQEVTLTIDNGFFTDAAATAADLDADPDPAAGALYGEWADNGKTVTVTTDASGTALVTVAIERDAGFDDDGKVTSTITAAAGNATNADPIQVVWTSTDALNPGSVEITPEQSKSRTAQTVKLNVFTRDQFGNLTKDDVVVSDDTADAGFVQGTTRVNSSVSVQSQYTNENPAVTVYGAADDVTQTVTATWTQARNTWRDGSTTAGFQGVRNTVNNNSVTDTATVEWYESVIDDSTVTLTSSPEGNVPVGTAVTETLTVLDDEGNPVPGVTVRFTQAGPGSTNTSVERTTNAQGQAFYVVTGAEEGTAQITAIVETGGAPVTKTDAVTFEGGVTPIVATLKAQSNGARADRLRILTKEDKAAGAVVKVFRFNNGKRIMVRKATLNANGNFALTVKDRNGKKFTRYVAVVKKTDLTNGARTNFRRVR